MKILVQKFGGSALGNIHRIKEAAAIARRSVNEGYSVVAVASAMGDTTDDLLELSNAFDAKKSKREMDLLLSTGEQVAASLLAMALNCDNIPANAYTGWQAGIITDSAFGTAAIKRIQSSQLHRCLKQKRVAVVTGYQGMAEDGAITTLGRGGSDTTALALAVALKAERCDIYTDVDGIYSCDPRLCASAFTYESVSFFEMLNFARAGAQVMAPSAMEIARNHDVPIRVRSAFNLRNPGTLITQNTAGTDFLGVACDQQQEIFACPSADSLAELANLQNLRAGAADLGITMEVVCRVGRKNANKAYFSVGNRHVLNAPELLKQLAKELKLPLEYKRSLAKVSIIGQFPNTNDTINKVFSCLMRNKICPRYWTIENGNRVSIWIQSSELKAAVEPLHHLLVEERLQVPA